MMLRLFLAIAFISGCQGLSPSTSSLQASSVDGPDPSTFSDSVTTSHFTIYYNATQTSITEVDAVKSAAETSFAQISNFLGDARTPAGTLTIQLEGDAQQPDHSFKYPHVGALARIHLYRYPGMGGQYESSLTHEMVHAFRNPVGLQHSSEWNDGFGFIEEAFAEFVARSVEPIGKGFTNYGFSVPLVAGQWINRGLDVPLVILATRHNQMSLKCMIQSYPERASFLFYLASTYGKEAVVDFAYQDDPITVSSMQTAFGKPLSELANAWRASALSQYQAIPNANSEAQNYWNNTPAKYFPYCKAGVDF